uniref:Uncharacterized protein n=1 Tax=Ditylenchus dipsaci TaxID=166011 RepID=A0A915EX81_9BILA
MTTGAEADSVLPTSPSTSNPSSCVEADKNVEKESLKELMFQHILGQSNVFYKSQQRGEADLSNEDKYSVLSNLFTSKPITFLERYHQFVSSDFICLFDKDDETEIYFKKITVAGKKASINSIRKADSHIRNLRFAAMKKLQKEEKLYLRPTVDVSLTNGRSASTFTGLLDRWSDAMISQRAEGMNMDRLIHIRTQLIVS